MSVGGVGTPSPFEPHIDVAPLDLAAAPAAPPAPAVAARPTLRIGARGDEVRALQEALNAFRASRGDPPIAADGIFGRGTEAAVRAFQLAKGLSVDGVVGPRTWAALAAGTGVAPTAPTTPSRPPITAPPPVTIAPALADLGALPDGTAVRVDKNTGAFTSTDRSGRVTTGPLALYQAAQLAAANPAIFSPQALGPAGLARVCQSLEIALEAGNGTAGTPRLADQQSRSGAATLALTLAKQLPDGDPIKGRLVAAYVAQMGRESLKGLRASMALNLEAAAKAGAVRLDATQAAALAAAKEATLPSRPPYDGWFKNGKTHLNMKQYIHPEFYDAMLSGYKEQGFKVDQDLGGGHLKMSKTYTDPSGRNPPMKVNVEVIKTYAEGHRPETRLFDDMDDANTDIEFYTGHSNLGGNVLGALREGPREQNGDKWVINWMCRGKQVLADVYNRFPDAHYTTTTDPAYVVHSGKFLNGMLNGIAQRKGYDDIWKGMGDTRLWWKPEVDLKDWFMPPNDPRILNVRDLDRDGKVDLSAASGIDLLYNVGLKTVTEAKRDLRPEAITANPQDLPGDKVMQGVNFLNTYLTYHLDEAEHPGGNDGRLPTDLGDKLNAAGWFKSDGDELVRITERTVNGRKQYDIAVNSKYANQDVDVLSAAMMYEVNKHFSIAKNGQYTEQDKIRGALFAGGYAAYMADTYEEADGIFDVLRAKYGFNDRLTWDNVNAAIDADQHGYSSPDAVRALKAKIGGADPRIG